MKSSNFNSLLHTDWHPEKGDFDKENSQKDSEQFKEKIRRQNILAISLTVFIVIAFLIAIVLL